MPTYLHLWNPTKWPWESLAADATATRAGEIWRGKWSCGSRRQYAFDARSFIMRTGATPGIIAASRIAGDTFSDECWDGSGREKMYIPLECDVVLEVSEILPRQRLETAIPEFKWASLQSSGVEVPSAAATQLEALWIEHLTDVGRV